MRFLLEAAADTTTNAKTSGIMTIVMLVAMLAIFYFLMYRPQKKQDRQQNEMRNGIEVGDEITTIGGICGRIIAVKDETDSVIIETGSDRARLRIKRWAIGSVDTIHEEDA